MRMPLDPTWLSVRVIWAWGREEEGRKEARYGHAMLARRRSLHATSWQSRMIKKWEDSNREIDQPGSSKRQPADPRSYANSPYAALYSEYGTDCRCEHKTRAKDGIGGCTELLTFLLSAFRRYQVHWLVWPVYEIVKPWIHPSQSIYLWSLDTSEI